MAKQIDLVNEEKYLSNLVNTGDEGQRMWAQNKAKEYGITLGQPNVQAPTQTATVGQSMPPGGQSFLQQAPSGFNQQQQMYEMMKWQQQMSDSNFQQQKAQLDMALESQMSQLKMAYEQAIADGQISVRDAEAQFAEQSKAIEQQAYLDSERTGLYTQDMGIQNSQQAVGLMQGDNARKNGLINQNMTTRDKRVNDIKDRLTSIRNQKNLDLARAQAEHGYGVAGARASANQQMAQNMFGLMKDDYSANRDQLFNQKNMYLGDELQRGQMQLQQGFTEKNMETQFQNSLKSATHDSNLAIERMNIQHGFDVAKMSQSLQNDLTKMSAQFGYSSALNEQEQNNRIEMISKEYEAKVKTEKDNYERDLERNLRGVTPGTKEYDLITKSAERDLKRKLTELHSSTVYEATVTDIINNKPEYDPKAPKNYKTDGITKYLPPSGSIYNFMSGYDNKKTEYDLQMEALKRYEEMMNSGSGYMPWNQ